MPFVIQNAANGKYTKILKSGKAKADLEYDDINKARIYGRKRDASESMNLRNFDREQFKIIEVGLTHKDPWRSMDTAPRFDEGEKNIPILLKYSYGIPGDVEDEYEEIVMASVGVWDSDAGHFFAYAAGRIYGKLLGWMYIHP